MSGATKLAAALILILSCRPHDVATVAAVRVERVGVLLAPGFEMLDAMGPYEALKEVENRYFSNIDVAARTWIAPEKSDVRCAGGETEISVEFLAKSAAAVASSSGVGIVPEFDMDGDPAATRYGLLVLGAGVDGPDIVDYVGRHLDAGGSLLTVCLGASVPAGMGLLDGAEATSNSLFLEDLRKEYSAVRWVDLADDLERRFVRSTGQITTTAGITAGIDGVLSQVEEWCGRDVAEATRQRLEWPLQLEKRGNKSHFRGQITA